MPEVKPPTAHPCATCPYRRDVPSGVWHPDEYSKLPAYDNDTMSQPAGVFMCHQRNEHLRSGWVGCHDMNQNLGLRFAAMKRSMSLEEIEAVLDYVCPVPLFASGAEAAAHGLADVEEPADRAVAAIGKLERQRGGRS